MKKVPDPFYKYILGISTGTQTICPLTSRMQLVPGRLLLRYLPLPGSWFPKPSNTRFQIGWNFSINNDSARGIQISSTTRYRQKKSDSFRFSRPLRTQNVHKPFIKRGAGVTSKAKPSPSGRQEEPLSPHRWGGKTYYRD